MKKTILTSLVTGTLIHTAVAAPGDLLWSDNFNAGNQGNFDNSPLGKPTLASNRLGGPLGGDLPTTQPDCVPRSSGFQQSIVADQLRLGGGRIRFQRSAAGARFDWAGVAGTPSPAMTAAAANIIASGGMKISFDYVPTNNTSTNWINVSVGFTAGFDGQAVNSGETDYGCLIRNNGNTERFDNGFNKGPGGTFPATTTTRHVEYLYAFPSFANGTEVRSRVIVDGVQVAADTFSWDLNSGQLYFVVEIGEVGTLVDNLTVNTIPAIYELTEADDEFISGAGTGGLVTTLSGGTFALGAEPSTFALVAGTGDTDNAKFAIDGDRIEVSGSYNFTQDQEGTQYFVRVQGTGNNTAGTKTKELILTLIKDDDADGLQDDWELSFAPNLTDLNGLGVGPGPGAGTGDFDNDGITDLAEFTYSTGLYPTISPILADSDGDGLDDDDELAPPGLLRPITNPIVADTDKDGLDDGDETNTGDFVSATNTGTSGANPDYDLDGVRDGFEVDKGSDPTDFASRPVLPPAFAIVPVTDDASTGISATTTYTHKISGGGAADINGVTLEELGIGITPTNFNWAVSIGGPGEINPSNNNNWLPANGNVTGPGVLAMYGAFTFMNDGNPGGFQTYTLSGLTIGETYKLKMFVRPWDQLSASFRPIDLEFTNGATVETPFGALPTDRPGIVLNNGINDSAFYVSYTYVAEATDLVIKASVHPSAIAASGSFHFYGLTNEVVPEPGSNLAITGVSRDGLGNIIIDFTGSPDTVYDVTKSPDLTTPFGPLTTPLTATTNVGGVGQAIVPASEASETKEFYRVEDQ